MGKPPAISTNSYGQSEPAAPGSRGRQTGRYDEDPVLAFTQQRRHQVDAAEAEENNGRDLEDAQKHGRSCADIVYKQLLRES